jgi:antitoxin component YwqK of YwqJK toxin-antitoxin module
MLSCKSKNKEIIETWPSGITKVERIYSNNRIDYIEKDYYENGQLLSETNFKNDKINGTVLEYHKNENLMFRGFQINGELAGKAISYYENGKQEREELYKNNKVFLENYWDSSGVQEITNGEGSIAISDILTKNKNNNDTSIEVIDSGYYSGGLHNGLWKYYDASSKKLILEINFKDNNVISENWK